MPAGLEVWDASGNLVFSVGKRYMHYLGTVEVPGKQWTYSVSPGDTGYTAGAEGTRLLSVPEGERIWVLARVDYSMRPIFLEVNQTTKYAFWRAFFYSSARNTFVSYPFTFDFGIFA